MIKPVFVPKAEQDTIAECERLEAEEKALEEAMKKRLEERKVKTKHILVEEIRKDKEIQKNLEAEVNGGEIDTYDEINEAEEYEAWKAREIARIKRDRDNREAMLKEEIENVSNMTEEERREWERKNPKPIQKWKFMQKHFHKGASSGHQLMIMLQPLEEMTTLNGTSPTGEDKMDKTILPKVMQMGIQSSTTIQYQETKTKRKQVTERLGIIGSKKLKDWELW